MGPGANPGGGPMMQGPGGPGMAGGPGGYMGQQGYGEPSKGYMNQGMYGRTSGGYAGGPGGYTGRWVSHPHTFQQLPPCIVPVLSFSCNKTQTTTSPSSVTRQTLEAPEGQLTSLRLPLLLPLQRLPPRQLQPPQQLWQPSRRNRTRK